MDNKELRALSPKELDERLAELRQKLFDLNRKKAVGSLENPLEVKGVRKEIARAETIKRERELGAKK
ncbi:MAG: 50S ribosomal protein L29 [Bacilli bacterium]|nr:50S ribosomal protein L29 [Bacilli bacterium]